MGGVLPSFVFVDDIIGIRHVLLPSIKQFNTIFFVMEKMEKDMREVLGGMIQTKQPLFPRSSLNFFVSSG